MRVLKKPTADPNDLFTTCISKVRNKHLRARLVTAKGEVAASAKAFEHAANTAALHTIPHSQDRVGDATAAEMMDVYTLRMVPAKSPGRAVYNEILAGADNGRCPLCGIGQVSTLDHHLPKATYPALSVVPLNLVPACTWCQKEKLQAFPATAEDQTLHPYFDDATGGTWLHAQVVQSVPAAFRFEVQRPAGWSNLMMARVRKHMEAFKLYRLYSSNAADELVGIRMVLNGLYAAKGCEGIEEEMTQRAQSWAAGWRNCWQAAMYRSASESDWFCDGGFAGV